MRVDANDHRWSAYTCDRCGIHSWTEASQWPCRGRLFIDLDGVLADFDAHYAKLFGVRPKRGLVDPPGFWENVHSVKTFFRDLPPMRDALTLWKGAQQLHRRPVILTGVPKSVPGVEAQKRAWVKHHLGSGVPVIAVESAKKRLHGQAGDVLVDDWNKYQPLWEEMGGVFVLHTSARKSLARLAELFPGRR